MTLCLLDVWRLIYDIFWASFRFVMTSSFSILMVNYKKPTLGRVVFRRQILWNHQFTIQYTLTMQKTQHCIWYRLLFHNQIHISVYIHVVIIALETSSSLYTKISGSRPNIQLLDMEFSVIVLQMIHLYGLSPHTTRPSPLIVNLAHSFSNNVCKDNIKLALISISINTLTILSIE